LQARLARIFTRDTREQFAESVRFNPQRDTLRFTEFRKQEESAMKSLCQKAVPVTVEPEEFDSRRALPEEYKDSAFLWILSHEIASDSGQGVEAFAHVLHRGADKNPNAGWEHSTHLQDIEQALE
jgi:hypothetical protein